MKSEKHKVEEHTFRCSKCRQVLDSRENLGAHMDTEHSHFCDKCGSVFDNKVLLASHVTKEHSYKCGYCTKLLDSEEAVLVCNNKFTLVCGNVFNTKFRLLDRKFEFVETFPGFAQLLGEI